MASTPPKLAVSVPSDELRVALSDVAGIDLFVWDMSDAAPRARIDLVVVPYMSSPELLRHLDGVTTRLVQGQMIGFEGVDRWLPAGMRFSNAAGVHEASTAELAIGLMIASQRRFATFVHAQTHGNWLGGRSLALTDARVVVIGQGGVGRAINERLAPFDVDLVRVATSARTDEHGPVHGFASLPELLPTADIVVLAVPLTSSTRGMVDRDFMATMEQGALLVNVSRGPVVVTDDLVAAVSAGSVRAAIDVVEPEPLPPRHPLWSLDGVLITPHVGGNSTAMVSRVVRLVRSQVHALMTGTDPVNVVIDGA